MGSGRITGDSEHSPVHSNTLWLVRTHQKRIIGPIVTEELILKIKSGQFEIEDEICQENGYWFSLQEVAETKRFLGLDIGMLQKIFNQLNDDEATQPDIGAVEVNEPAQKNPYTNSSQTQVPTKKRIFEKGTLLNLFIIAGFILIGFTVRWVIQVLSRV